MVQRYREYCYEPVTFLLSFLHTSLMTANYTLYSNNFILNHTVYGSQLPTATLPKE